ncbi:LuxR family transcriptional regulator [Bradyrhizobium sp. INPA01-394B]|uniref:Autoinducer binding domain-containing protein n=1 Tax=Bradyrhizobium campsiandrae TaxID=1729892 RepID=A0ABR7U2A4_9BRAD|nr:autoinducer binding domain-containing protein [Bradyrhizobium campsiandrae]MBC9877663.1 LuxR family transcriptional regulator [Bradyrhizobium campsiandrae]MBC9978097.1 autoinducer binding domain-containing protein [Bradyrhizobium campsiandrae]
MTDLFWSTWEIISLIEQAVDEGALKNCLIDIAKSYGFASVFGGIVPPGGMRNSKVEIQARAVVQYFPDGWAARYLDQNYLPRDPIVGRLQKDRNAFSWSESYKSCPEPDNVRAVGGEAADFGLVEGFVIPITTLDQRIAALSFGGARDDLSNRDRSALTFLANFAIGHWLYLRRPRPTCNKTLSPRELDCLLWAGEGKTDWEISVILGISRSTVTKHITSAREKLNAVNKPHAIAIAMRLKILG